MSALVNCGGKDDIRHGRRLFSSLMDSSRCVSLAHAGVYFPPHKRARPSPSSFSPEGWGNSGSQSEEVSIDSLPDECLFEILRRVEDKRERSLSACVSKRWLMLLSTIRSSDIPPSVACKLQKNLLPDLNESVVYQEHDEDLDLSEDDEMFHSRCLEGKEATDVRLLAMAVGTTCRGGISELLIRGCNASRPVTDIGLGAVARGSPSLRVLSLWNSPSITDEGLAQIADHCPLLEKLDLCRCTSISDKGLIAIANKCPKLSSLVIESCPKIGNEGLQSIGRCCQLLKSVSIVDLGLVADQGVASLVSSTSTSLQKMKLQHVNITDASLAVIGYYGKEISDLVFTGLPLISERGFWVMGSGRGLQKLRSFTVTSCGVTDVGLKAVAEGCPMLKKLHLRRCIYLSDAGLNAFVSAAGSLEALQLEECNRITLVGILGALLNCQAKLRSLELTSCMGVKDVADSSLVSIRFCLSLRSLRICHCPGFGDSSLALVGKLCPRLQHISLSGLVAVTDAGLLPVVEGCDLGLLKISLSGCINVTDAAAFALVKQHGGTLQTLSLEGCRKVTDETLLAVADYCMVLENLDVSKCAISDDGVAALASAVGVLGLQVLSLSGCSKISSGSLQHLNKLGHMLAGLNLQLCNSISTHAIASLQKKMPQCDILS